MSQRKIELYNEAVKLQKMKKIEYDLPHLFGFKPYQWTLDYWNSTNRMKFLVAANQSSKGQALDAMIPTPNGYKTIGSLSIGEEVFGKDGLPTKIKSFPWSGEDLFYKVTFDDGDSVEVTKDHDWICMGPRERFRKEYTFSGRCKQKGKFPNVNYQKWIVRSTQEIFDHCYSRGGVPTPRQRYAIPMCEPVEYEEKNLPIDPYLLGCLIGDGCLKSRGKTISLNYDDKEIIALFISQGATVRSKDENRHCQALGVGFLAKEINALGLNVNGEFKKIPEIYKLASIEQRKALLAGLMDTDGTTDGRGCTYSTASEELAKDFKELANSLGCMAEIFRYKAGYKDKDGEFIRCKDNFNVTLFAEFNPFRLSARKRDRWAAPRRYKHQRVIYKIEPIGVKKGRCISVSNESGSYLAGPEYIVTHNSTTQIRHAIDLATDRKKWPKFFPRGAPSVFWYIYPDGNKINEEFLTKWVPECMPRGEMMNHHQYGWKKLHFKNNFVGVRFNTGVSIFFKSWRQDFQSSTLDAVFVDEEIPYDQYDELSQRLTVRNGIFSMVFTATIGQKEWYDVIELKGKHGEKFPSAFKRQISLEYDCRYYADGTPSPFTPEEIERRKSLLSSQREIDRRVHGRFVSDEGLAFPSFEKTRNVKPKANLDKNSYFFGGVDIGTGGREGHPASISIVQVDKSFKRGRLIRFWKGNRHDTTNSSEILEKYNHLTKDLNMTGNFYDWHSKEFLLRAQGAGVPFQKAEKAREFGFDLLNTLFKNEMLDIEEGTQTDELIYELENLKITAKKTRAEDDGIDGLRYAISSVAWDFSGIMTQLEEKINREAQEMRARPKTTRHDKTIDDVVSKEWNYESDIDEYNSLYEGME